MIKTLTIATILISFAISGKGQILSGFGINYMYGIIGIKGYENSYSYGSSMLSYQPKSSLNVLYNAKYDLAKWLSFDLNIPFSYNSGYESLSKYSQDPHSPGFELNNFGNYNFTNIGLNLNCGLRIKKTTLYFGPSFQFNIFGSETASGNSRNWEYNVGYIDLSWENEKQLYKPFDIILKGITISLNQELSKNLNFRFLGSFHNISKTFNTFNTRFTYNKSLQFGFGLIYYFSVKKQ
jgi:hypothetical protein